MQKIKFQVVVSTIIHFQMNRLIKNTVFLFLLVFYGSFQLAADPLEQGFRNPPHQAKPHTWWHWMNGNITREGITADLEAMARVGIGGAQIFNIAGSHGCDIPAGSVDYLSPEWLDLLKHAAMEAERLGLDLALQNCAGWASTGGPWVPAQSSSQILVHTEVKLEGGAKLDAPLPKAEARHGYYRDIAVLAFPTPKDDKARLPRWTTAALYKTTRLSRKPSLRQRSADMAIDPASVVDITQHLQPNGWLDWKAPNGNWTIVRLGHTSSGATNHPAPDSGRGLEINKLGPGGVALHWDKGIQPILDHLGPLSGNVLKAILMDSYEGGFANWTAEMREEFHRRRGYAMDPYLLALTGRVIGDAPRTERFLWDFRRTIGDLYADYYYKPFVAEAHKRGLETYIEPYRGPFESMRAGAPVDIPMGEFWIKKVYVNSLKVASSLGHLHKRNIIAAESFTAGPKEARWLNSPASLRRPGDNAWADGVNRFVFHRFAHQPWLDQFPGMTMGQYGSHIDRTNTWWEPGRAWMHYIARSQYLLQQGESVNDVLCFVGEASPSVGGDSFASLKLAGYDYDLCGTDIIHQLTVDEGEIVTPSGRRYQLLLLPNTSFQTIALSEQLQKLVKAGASVLGPRPLHSPSMLDFPESENKVKAISDNIWQDCDGKVVKSTRYGRGRVFAGLRADQALANMEVPARLLLPKDANLVWTHRKTDDAEIFFISNQSNTLMSDAVSFRVAGKVPEIWDAETGQIVEVLDWVKKGPYVEMPIFLHPEKSVFVVFRKNTEKSQGAWHGKLSLDANDQGSWPVQPASESQLRVWRNGQYQLKSTENNGPVQVTEVPKPMELSGPWDFRFEENRGAPDKARFTELKSWSEHRDPGIRHFSGTATASICFELPEHYLAQDRELWLDLGQLEVIADLRINGQGLGVLWHPPYRLEVSHALKPGKNTLEVDVTNLWVNRLIGDEQHRDEADWKDGHLTEWPQWLLEGKPRPESGRIAFTTWKHWRVHDALQPSGLIGPVVLRPALLVDLPK